MKKEKKRREIPEKNKDKIKKQSDNAEKEKNLRKRLNVLNQEFMAIRVLKKV